MFSGSTNIVRYPRDIPSLVRRADTTRKEARERKKQRKEEEIQKKKEEVRRMKSLKAKEIREKLDKVGKEGGLETSGEFTTPSTAPNACLQRTRFNLFDETQHLRSSILMATGTH